MSHAFNLNNRNGDPKFAKTLEKLSDMLKDDIDLVKEPFIMLSYGSREVPKVEFRGSYFQGKPIDFSKAYVTGKKFIFYIIANSFKETFSSHAMVGYWNGSKVIVFDPNGDIDTTNDESVYQGFGFRIANSRHHLENPLYKTLLNYYRRKAIRTEFYTDNPISCPANIPNSCAYRCLLYIIARARYGDSNKKVYEYTEELVPKIKDILNQMSI